MSGLVLDHIERIVTPRLLLRPVDSSDADALFVLFADRDVIRWLSAPPWPYARDDMDRFLASITSDETPDRENFLVIEMSGAPIGGISWRMREASHLQAGSGPNIGYWLGRQYWGQGLMPEAVRGLVRELLATNPADAVYSGAFAGNAQSLRVQAKLGFERTGMTRLRSNPQNADLPHINTRLLRTRFEA